MKGLCFKTVDTPARRELSETALAAVWWGWGGGKASSKREVSPSVDTGSSTLRTRPERASTSAVGFVEADVSGRWVSSGEESHSEGSGYLGWPTDREQ